MKLRSIQLSAVAFVLFVCFFAFGMARPAGSKAATSNKARTNHASAPTTWVFEGCWSQYQTSTCKDVYLDEQGNYWICKDCGTTNNPSPNKCTMTNSIALSRGFWCS